MSKYTRLMSQYTRYGANEEKNDINFIEDIGVTSDVMLARLRAD